MFERTERADTFEEDHYMEGWRPMSFQEILVIVLENLINKKGSQWAQGKGILVNKGVQMPVVETYC
jgi:hypothetical protein